MKLTNLLEQEKTYRQFWKGVYLCKNLKKGLENILEFLNDDVIILDDLDEFSDELKETIKYMRGRWKWEKLKKQWKHIMTILKN